MGVETFTAPLTPQLNIVRDTDAPREGWGYSNAADRNVSYTWGISKVVDGVEYALSHQTQHITDGSPITGTDYQSLKWDNDSSDGVKYKLYLKKATGAYGLVAVLDNTSDVSGGKKKFTYFGEPPDFSESPRENNIFFKTEDDSAQFQTYIGRLRFTQAPENYRTRETFWVADDNYSPVKGPYEAVMEGSYHIVYKNGSYANPNEIDQGVSLKIITLKNTPKAATFVGQRLAASGRLDSAESVYLSKLGDYTNFEDVVTVLDNSPYELKVSSEKFNAINHLIGGRGLFLFASDGIFRVTNQRSSLEVRAEMLEELSASGWFR